MCPSAALRARIYSKYLEMRVRGKFVNILRIREKNACRGLHWFTLNGLGVGVVVEVAGVMLHLAVVRVRVFAPRVFE